MNFNEYSVLICKVSITIMLYNILCMLSIFIYIDYIIIIAIDIRKIVNIK